MSYFCLADLMGLFYGKKDTNKKEDKDGTNYESAILTGQHSYKQYKEFVNLHFQGCLEVKRSEEQEFFYINGEICQGYEFKEDLIIGICNPTIKKSAISLKQEFCRILLDPQKRNSITGTPTLLAKLVETNERILEESVEKIARKRKKKNGEIIDSITSSIKEFFYKYKDELEAVKLVQSILIRFQKLMETTNDNEKIHSLAIIVVWLLLIALLQKKIMIIEEEHDNLYALNFNVRNLDIHFQMYGGRIQDVDKLIARNGFDMKIKETLRTKKLVVLYGELGRGKTSIAKLYAKEHRFDYDNNILFLRSETMADFLSDLMMVEIDDYSNLWDKIYCKLENIVKDQRCLLIFDNVSYDWNATDLEKSFEDTLLDMISYVYRQYGKYVDVIITTRRTNLRFADDISYEKICVKEYDSGETENFFRSMNISISSRDRDKIVQSYGRNPLILSTVVALYKEHGNKIDADLDLTEDCVHEGKSLDTVLRKLLKQISNSQDGKIYIQALKLISYMDSDKIQLDLLFHAITYLGNNISKRYLETIMINYSKRCSLTEYRTEEEKVFSIHRGYQKALRSIYGSDQMKTINAVIKGLRDCIFWQSYYGYPQWEAVKQHEKTIQMLYTDVEEVDMPDILLSLSWYKGWVLREKDFAKYANKITHQNGKFYIFSKLDDIMIRMRKEIAPTNNIKIIEKWIEYIEKEEDQDELSIRYYYCLSRYKWFYGSGKEAVSAVQKGLERCEKLEKSLQFGNLKSMTFVCEHKIALYNQYGFLQRLFYRNYDEAIEMHKKSLTVIEENSYLFGGKNVIQLAETQNAIGVCYFERKKSIDNLKEAIRRFDAAKIEYEDETLRFYRANEIVNIANANRELGNLYMNLYLTEDKEEDYEMFCQYRDEAKAELNEYHDIIENTESMNYYRRYVAEWHFLCFRDSRLPEGQKRQHIEAACDELEKILTAIENSECEHRMTYVICKRYLGNVYRYLAEMENDEEKKEKYYAQAIVEYQLSNESAKENGNYQSYFLVLIEIAIITWKTEGVQTGLEKLNDIKQEMEQVNWRSEVVEQRFDRIKSIMQGFLVQDDE